MFGKSNEAALALEGESSALRTPHGLGLTIFPNGSIELAAEKPTWNLRIYSSFYSPLLIFMVCLDHNQVVVPTTFEAPTRYELFRSDSFVLFKSANWDEGISFDDSWVRYFFVLHKKPGNLNLRFKLKVRLSSPSPFHPSYSTSSASISVSSSISISSSSLNLLFRLRACPLLTSTHQKLC